VTRDVRPVAVLGNLSKDRVPGLGEYRLGGAPFWAARALQLADEYPLRLGVRCAEQDRSLLLPPLMALGEPVSWRPARATATFAYTYSGDERFMHVEAVGEPWELDGLRGWLDELLDPVEWVHVGALARSDFPRDTLEAIARGRSVLFDGQGLVRPGLPGELHLDGDFDHELLRFVTALKLSEEEAETVVGGEVTAASLAELGVPEVLVTRGSRGALLWTAGELKELKTEALEIGDPTGAGDAFCLFYATARARGRSPLEAARHAVTMSTRSLSPPSG